jgi:hypothetical protein
MAPYTVVREVRVTDQSDVIRPEFATNFHVIMEAGAVTLLFSAKDFVFDEAAPTTQQRRVGAISMTHVIAKDLVKILNRSLEQFESATGSPIAALKAADEKGAKGG